MQSRTIYPINMLLIMLLLVAAGCTGSKTAVQPDPNQEAIVEDEASTEGHRSGGIAAVAGEDAGWASTVDGEEAKNQPFSFTEQLLKGQIPGVEVIERPGGGFSVRIRGASSFLGGTEPLYIVDGMPVLHTTGEGLTWLNTRDIKKIEVLKDADAKAIYGARGANGVVLITTKLGPEN